MFYFEKEKMDQKEEMQQRPPRPVITFRNKVISPQRVHEDEVASPSLESSSPSIPSGISPVSPASPAVSESSSLQEEYSPFASVLEEEKKSATFDDYDFIDDSPFVVHDDFPQKISDSQNQGEKEKNLFIGIDPTEDFQRYLPSQEFIEQEIAKIFCEKKNFCEEGSDFSPFSSVIESWPKEETSERKIASSHEDPSPLIEETSPLTEEKNSPSDQKKSVSVFKKIRKIFEIMVIIGFIGCIFFIAQRLRKNVFEGLPDVSQIKDMQFQQATIITDRNGVELYKIFEENREYVDISEINQHMINAIIAIEDQRYWTHDGLDPMGIIRSIVKKSGGASTIPQQLMTNLFDLKEEISDTQYGTYEYYLEKAKYKLRQIVLSRKLTTVLSRQIKAENPDLNEEQSKKEMKNKILEIYLNYIEFGNNAFGVEAAAQSYFRTSAKDLSIVQSAILASFPKGPTQYSPFTESGRKRLMGYFICKNEQKEVIPCNDLKSDIEEKFIANLQKADFKKIEKSEQYPGYLNKLGTFTLEKEEYLQEEDSEDGSSDEGNREENKIIHTYSIAYQYGRKDSVLLRMFEDQYITEEELINAIIEGRKVQFYKPNFEIKSPHFVFWIKDILEEKYGNKIKNGFIVKTSLDYTIQQQAEEILRNNKKILNKYQANNSAMLYLDTDQGDILAYVGSLDYFNTEIQGQNDMVRSPRQSGSSIKPLLYALGIMNLRLTIDSPIYDLYFSVDGKVPHNADGGYQGLLPLRLALGHSRNIPSVKIFQALGGENVVKPFYKSLGLTDIDDDQIYGYSLSLGAAEVPMLQLAQAYSHLTTKTPATIDPILSITDHNGEIIYQKQIEEKPEIIPSGVKYLLWDILSNPNNRITGWINKFTINGLKYALKTGTSNMIKNGKSLPRDGRMVAYLQNKLVLMRAGNADASPMSSSAYGGEIHATTIKNFLKWLVDKKYVQNSPLPKEEVASVTISKLTGKIVNKSNAGSLAVTTLGYANALPVNKETIEQFSYDADCFGVVSELSENVKKGFFVSTLDSFMPNNDDIKSIRDYLAKAYPNLFQKKPRNYCPDADPSNKYLNISFETPYHNQTISADTNISINVNGGLYLSSYKLYLDNQIISERSYVKKSQKSDRISKYLNIANYSEGYHTIKVEVTAQAGYKESKSISLYIKKPEKISINSFYVSEGVSDTYQIGASVESNRNLQSIVFFIDDTQIYKKNYSSQKSATISFTENFSDFSEGKHSIILEVTTQEGGYNSSIKNIYLGRREESFEE